MSFAERLEKALRAKGMNGHSLHKRLDEATNGSRGSSYGSVRDLLAGRVELPSDRILEAMAAILDVKEGWLRAGEGPMRQAAVGTHTGSGTGATSSGRAEESWAQDLGRVLEEDELYNDLEPWPDLQASYAQLAFDLAPLGPDNEMAEIAAYLRGIAWIIHSPWGILNSGTAAPVRSDLYAHYVRAMLNTLRLAEPMNGDVEDQRLLEVVSSFGTLMDDQVRGAEDAEA